MGCRASGRTASVKSRGDAASFANEAGRSGGTVLFDLTRTVSSRSWSTRAGRRSIKPSSSIQVYSPITGSNEAIDDELLLEFLPMFADAITPLDWLWEPEITTEMGIEVQALVKGDRDPASVGAALQAVADQLRASGRSYRQ